MDRAIRADIVYLQIDLTTEKRLVSADLPLHVHFTFLRLGMSPRMIAGASRFLGLPGLLLGTGLSAYDAYKNYQNQEGMIYNLFNKDE